MKPATFKGLPFSAGEKMGVMGMGFPFKSQELRAVVTACRRVLYLCGARRYGLTMYPVCPIIKYLGKRDFNGSILLQIQVYVNHCKLVLKTESPGMVLC